MKTILLALAVAAAAVPANALVYSGTTDGNGITAYLGNYHAGAMHIEVTFDTPTTLTYATAEMNGFTEYGENETLNFVSYDVSRTGAATYSADVMVDQHTTPRSYYNVGDYTDTTVLSADAAAGVGYKIVTSGVATVPEPATWALLITGFGFTGSAMRRRVAVAR